MSFPDWVVGCFVKQANGIPQSNYPVCTGFLENSWKWLVTPGKQS